jgi:hypothetical protein
LEDVHRSVLKNQCYLVIQYNGSRYVGVLQCEDGEFLERVYRCLSQERGKPIHEIGELDIDLEYRAGQSLNPPNPPGAAPAKKTNQ